MVVELLKDDFVKKLGNERRVRDRAIVLLHCCRLRAFVYTIQSCTMSRDYWAVQAELLTSLTFARHRLSPLAAFTSRAYFLHNGWR